MNPDASGRARVKISAPTLLFSKFGGVEQIIVDAKEGLATSNNVSLTQINAVTDGSQTTLSARLTFKDARQVGSILQSFRDPPGSPKKSDQEILFGETHLNVSVPKILFSRKIDIAPLVPAGSINPMTSQLLGDSHLSYQLHLPTTATSHNANQVSNEGKSLHWQFPLSTLLAGPVEMKFTAPIPNLSRYLTLTALILLFAIALLVFFITQRKKRLKPTPTSP